MYGDVCLCYEIMDVDVCVALTRGVDARYVWFQV